MMDMILMQAAGQGGGSSWSGLIMILAIFVIFYFFMIRPQSKKQKEIKKAREALSVDDKVVTAGGIYGKIKEVKETTFIVEVAPGVSLKIDKNNIYPVVQENNNSRK